MPIAFYSRKLTPTQQNYTTIDVKIFGAAGASSPVPAGLRVRD